MKLLFTFLINILFLCVAICQESPNIKFGVINRNELDMAFDVSDSSAEAVLLYEKEDVYYTNYTNSAVNIEYYARIKILKSSGLDRGNINI